MGNDISFINNYKKELPRYSRSEIEKHNHENSCWLIVDNKVYDITNMLPVHPAEKESILRKGGGDATVDFYFHSTRARKAWKSYLIGYVMD